MPMGTLHIGSFIGVVPGTTTMVCSIRCVLPKSPSYLENTFWNTVNRFASCKHCLTSKWVQLLCHNSLRCSGISLQTPYFPPILSASLFCSTILVTSFMVWSSSVIYVGWKCSVRGCSLLSPWCVIMIVCCPVEVWHVLACGMLPSGGGCWIFLPDTGAFPPSFLVSDFTGPLLASHWLVHCPVVPGSFTQSGSSMLVLEYLLL